MLLAAALACAAGALAQPGAALAGASRAAPAPALAPAAKPSSAGVEVHVLPGPTGAAIPSGFLGLSLETPALANPAVSEVSPALVRLLRGLGAGVLRLSGVSVDRTQWVGAAEAPAPWRVATIAPADLAHLAALMDASGWQLLLGLNLGHPNAAALIEESRAARTILGGSLAAVELGNEPDLYTRPPSAPFRAAIGAEALRTAGWGLPQYEAEVAALRGTLAAAGVPVALYGPDTAGLTWLAPYAQAQGRGLASLAAHFYPLDRCHAGKLLANSAPISGLLSLRVATREAHDLASLARLSASSGLPLRIDETNSVACAGQPGTSDTFAAALWALDFSLLAAHAGVSGVNFHGGLGSCTVGGTIQSPWYSPLCTASDGQLQARPEYYALLLVRALEGCSFVPVSYRTTRDVAVFALRAPDGTLRVVVDDMEVAHRSGRRRSAPLIVPAPVRVELHVESEYARASVARLVAAAAQARSGVSFGGSSVAPDGGFSGAATQPLAGARGSFALTLRPASAALVTLSGGAG